MRRPLPAVVAVQVATLVTTIAAIIVTAALVVPTASADPAPTDSPRLVLIIDDLGNNYALGERAIQLPGAITYSVLPHTPDAVALATLAHKTGKQVMVHVPMTSIDHRRLGPGALTSAMRPAELLVWLRYDIASIPYVRGVNNHMGSALTADPVAMHWVMRGLQCHDLYFVDSRTTAATVAASAASTAGVRHLSRNVFLDDSRKRPAMRHQLQRWLALARKNGFAVAIAHPHPATLAFLERHLPDVGADGYRLVFPSDILAHPTPAAHWRIARTQRMTR